jgi:hypothetical protein
MKVPQSSFEPGVTRLFGNGDIGLSGLVSGWATPEDAHLWNDGAGAIMELTVPPPDRRYTLELEGEPFIDSECPSQEMTLYCNGFWIGCWKFEERKSYTLYTPIEPEQLFIRHDMAFARLVWLLPQSTRPAGSKWNDDGRRLGFCFRALTFRHADEAAIDPFT